MTEEKKLPADVNGDGTVDDEEKRMYIEFRRKELEDQDLMRDSQRKMTWFALFGIFCTSLFGLDSAAKIIGDIAPTYFVAIAALVSAFFGVQAFNKNKDK